MDPLRVKRRPRSRRSTARSGERAQSLLEAALIMPLLLTIVLIGVDFGRLYASQVTVTDAARQAARYAASNPGDQSAASPCGQWKTTVATAQQEAAGSPVSIDCANVAVTAAGPDSYGAKFVTASVKAPFSFVTPFLSPLLHVDHVSGSDTAREYNPAVCTATYAGRAYGVGVTGVKIGLGLISIPDTIVGDSGVLASSGGTSTYGGSLSVSIASLLTAQLILDTTTGGSCYVSAHSTVASVSVLPLAVAGGVLTATVLDGATAMPCSGTATQTGTVATLKIAGISIALPAGANQVVNVPNTATVYLNRQQPGANPPTVDALSVVFPPGGLLSAVIVGTITIAHAQAGC